MKQKEQGKQQFYNGWFDNFGALYPIPHPYWENQGFAEKHWLRKDGDCRFCDSHENHRIFALSRSGDLISCCDECYKEFNFYIFN